MPDILEQLREVLLGLPNWVVRVLLAAFTLLIFYLLRRFVLQIVENWVQRLAQRIGGGQTSNIVAALMLPVRFLLVAAALAIAIRVLTPDSSTSAFIDNLIRSLVIVAAFVGLFRLVDIFALDAERLQLLIGFNIEERLMPIIRTGLKLALFVVAVFIVMGEWQIDVSGLLASLGIVGLAFSLAAQDTVSNLFGFSTIVGDRPFMVGEYIRTSDLEGVVENVGIRSTRIRKPDRALITVPNSVLATAPVERFLYRRIEFTLGVTYATTADEMETLIERLREMLRVRPRIIASSVAVYFTGFGNSSLDILILCDVTIRDWTALMTEREQVNLAVMRIVADMGLSIAFPTRSIYIDGLPPALKLDRIQPDTTPEDHPEEPSE